MAILMFAARKHQLIDQQYRMQERLKEITNKLMDLQQYAANIADGSVSMFDMMNTPSSMMQRQIAFMGFSHNMALQNAQMNFSNMAPMYQQQLAGMDANSQMMYQNWIMQNLYKQERERFAKMEAKVLNQQEKELTNEKLQLESQLKMVEQDLESCKQAEDAGIKAFKPNYVG